MDKVFFPIFMFLTSCLLNCQPVQGIETGQINKAIPFQEYVCLPIIEAKKNELVVRLPDGTAMFLVDGKKIRAKDNICKCEENETIIKTTNSSIQLPIWLQKDTIHFDSCHYYTLPIKERVCIALYNSQNYFIKTLKDGTHIYKENGKKVRAKGNFCKCLSKETLISTPSGKIPIHKLKVGDEIWTYDLTYLQERKKIKAICKIPVPKNYQILRFTLKSSKQLIVSYEHPLSRNDNRKPIGALEVGMPLGFDSIVKKTIIPYSHDYTYDILPEGFTGDYLANGVLLGSTLLSNHIMLQESPITINCVRYFHRPQGIAGSIDITSTFRFSPKSEKPSFKIKTLNGIDMKDFKLDFKALEVDTVLLKLHQFNSGSTQNQLIVELLNTKKEVLQKIPIESTAIPTNYHKQTCALAITYEHEGRLYQKLIKKPKNNHVLLVP